MVLKLKFIKDIMQRVNENDFRSVSDLDWIISEFAHEYVRLKDSSWQDTILFRNCKDKEERKNLYSKILDRFTVFNAEIDIFLMQKDSGRFGSISRLDRYLSHVLEQKKLYRKFGELLVLRDLSRIDCGDFIRRAGKYDTARDVFSKVDTDSREINITGPLHGPKHYFLSLIYSEKAAKKFIKGNYEKASKFYAQSLDNVQKVGILSEKDLSGNLYKDAKENYSPALLEIVEMNEKKFSVMRYARVLALAGEMSFLGKFNGKGTFSSLDDTYLQDMEEHQKGLIDSIPGIDRIVWNTNIEISKSLIGIMKGDFEAADKHLRSAQITAGDAGPLYEKAIRIYDALSLHMMGQKKDARDFVSDQLRSYEENKDLFSPIHQVMLRYVSGTMNIK